MLYVYLTLTLKTYLNCRISLTEYCKARSTNTERALTDGIYFLSSCGYFFNANKGLAMESSRIHNSKLCHRGRI